MEQGKVTITKSMLDQRVASLLGKKGRDVSSVTSAFIDAVVEALTEEDGDVRLDGLGTMHVVERTGVRQQVCTLTKGYGHKKGRRGTTVVSVPSKYYLVLRKGTRLRDALNQRRRSKAMEKYGVDESTDQEKLEKQASEGCPKCGGKVERHGSTLMCRNCGTEPFEQKKT